MAVHDPESPAFASALLVSVRGGTGADVAMLTDIDPDRVCLARGSTGLRKSIDGVAALVREGFALDQFSSGG